MSKITKLFKQIDINRISHPIALLALGFLCLSWLAQRFIHNFNDEKYKLIIALSAIISFSIVLLCTIYLAIRYFNFDFSFKAERMRLKLKNTEDRAKEMSEQVDVE